MMGMTGKCLSGKHEITSIPINKQHGYLPIDKQHEYLPIIHPVWLFFL